jgi:hypothetical protein
MSKKIKIGLTLSGKHGIVVTGGMEQLKKHREKAILRSEIVLTVRNSMIDQFA